MNKQVPDGWKLYKLNDVALKSDKYSLTGGPFGSDLKSEDYTNEGVRIIQLQNIGDGEFKNRYKIFTSPEKADELSSCNIFPDDIILSKMGDPVARATILPSFDSRYLMASDGIRLAIDKHHFDTKFIHDFINSPLFRTQAELNSTGSTRKRIGLTQLKQLTLFAPSLPEQQKIATILTSVDTVIEKTRAQIDKLKHLKTGMMQELLTQGIGHTEFKDTPIGRIPKAWKVVTMGKAGSWKGGGTPSKANKEFWNGDIPWVSPKDMKSEFIDKTEDYITEHAITASSTNSVPASSILIVARSGILKHTLPVAIAAVDVTINQDMKALIVNDKVLALYLFHYLQANNHKVLRATLKAGNTVESLDFSEFIQYQIPLPPVSEQQKIIDVMESIANRLRSKQQLLKSYELTKKALMQDLLTGKVRVEPTARC